MLIVDMSEVKLPGEARQNNLPPECGQPIDVGDCTAWINVCTHWIQRQNKPVAIFLEFIGHVYKQKPTYLIDQTAASAIM
jgi:hypothetical protein